MDETEATFVKTFIARDRRERWLTFLPSEKKRNKLLRCLSHNLESELDSRFVYDEDDPPAETKTQIAAVLKGWKKENPQQLCHIIGNSSEIDGKSFPLSVLEVEMLPNEPFYGPLHGDLSIGAIIIVIPDKLAYYRPERSNLSMQLFKVLFRT